MSIIQKRVAQKEEQFSLGPLTKQQEFKTKIVSGIQPSGDLHLGNYLGSVKQWVDLLKLSPSTQAVFFLADLHAVTVSQDPQILQKKVLEVAAIYLATGIDYKKHTIFIQSHNLDHANLGWLFNCITPIGWLKRMTQFKDKKQKLKGYQKSVSTGLFTYPTLMAADILLYDPDYVPVGIDQKQHVELTVDIAKKFNSQFGETFKIPQVKINKVTAKIYDLQNPTKKMSKSDASNKGRIGLLEDIDSIKDKIMRATTDSDNHIKYDLKNKPGISNLLAIMSSITGNKISVLEEEFSVLNYSQFKEKVAEVVVDYLRPLQAKINLFLNDTAELKRILAQGAIKSQQESVLKLATVKQKMGLS